VNSPHVGQGLPQSSNPLPPVKSLSDEWAILKLLKRWTAADIQHAIDSDTRLAALLEEYSDNIVARTLMHFARRHNGLSTYLSPENVLYWFSERRPDLYAEIVKTPQGVMWLTGNFRELRQFFNI